MAETLTAEVLAELARLEAAMTPAPWYAHNPDDPSFMNVFCVSTSPREPNTNNDDGQGVVAVTLLQSFVPIAHEGQRWQEDAAGIAALRNAAKGLLVEAGEAARLREENARLREALAPFAYQAAIIASNEEEGGQKLDPATHFRLFSSLTAITVGNCKRAAAALTPPAAAAGTAAGPPAAGT